MHKCLIVFICGVVASLAQAQENPSNLLEIKPHKEFENILVKPLDSDSMASTFLIWVKDSVAAHYHTHHTEVVYVLSGSADMRLGQHVRQMRAGDYVYIHPGEVHAVQVTSDGPVKVLSVQTPIFTGTDRIFLTE